MDREVISRCCRNAGLREEKRQLVEEGYDCFIADGFCTTPDFTFWRFGIEKADFPHGCYATFWWLGRGEDFIELGRPMFFEPYHDPQLSDKDARKRARINRALYEARKFLKDRQKVRKRNGV